MLVSFIKVFLVINFLCSLPASTCSVVKRLHFVFSWRRLHKLWRSGHTSELFSFIFRLLFVCLFSGQCKLLWSRIIEIRDWWMLCKQIAFDIAELVYLIITHSHSPYFTTLCKVPDETDAKFLIASSLENWRRPPGRPRTTCMWMKTIQQDLKSNNLPLNEVVQNRPLGDWCPHLVLPTTSDTCQKWMNDFLSVSTADM